MSWAIFQAARTKNGESLGTIRKYIAKFEQPLVINRTMQLAAVGVQYPDYPFEADIFVENADQKAILLAAGFDSQRVNNTRDYLDETWTLNTGASITFFESSGVMNIGLKNPGAVRYSQIITLNPNPNQAQLYYLPCLIGAITGATSHVIKETDKEGTMPTTTIYSAESPLAYFGTYPENGLSYPLTFYSFTPEDPFEGGGTSGPGGGGGDFTDDTTPIDVPGLPALSAADTGFVRLFNPSLTELQNLCRYMWSDLFTLDGWKKIFADPMDAILGLSIVPVAVPDGGQIPVKVGNVSTDVMMNLAASQFVTVDCGSIDVKEFWGAYLDYEPYTKAEIYLPYIGIHQIAVDDIMSKTVQVVYHVDILSGSCCAHIKCGDSVLYSFVGQCASSIPVTGSNWNSLINGAISVATSIGTMVATGGLSAPSAASQIASTAINQIKPSIEKSGSISSTGGLLGIQTPYLILTRPRQALPQNQNVYEGYPSFITSNFGSLKGYTEIESVHLTNIPATADELSELESILKGGVIF